MWELSPLLDLRYPDKPQFLIIETSPDGKNTTDIAIFWRRKDAERVIRLANQSSTPWEHSHKEKLT